MMRRAEEKKEDEGGKERGTGEVSIGDAGRAHSDYRSVRRDARRIHVSALHLAYGEHL